MVQLVVDNCQVVILFTGAQKEKGQRDLITRKLAMAMQGVMHGTLDQLVHLIPCPLVSRRYVHCEAFPMIRHPLNGLGTWENIPAFAGVCRAQHHQHLDRLVRSFLWFSQKILFMEHSLVFCRDARLNSSAKAA